MLSVPAPPRFVAANAPLTQALVQVNYPVVPRLESLSGIAPLQEALEGRFPYMNRSRVQQVSMMVGPAGPAAAQAEESWVNEFTDDEGWNLSVTATSASLSVGNEYAGVDDFAGRFATVCQALADAARVTRCERLGVRYLDVVETESSNGGWARAFRPELVGLANPALIAEDRLIASITETRVQRPSDGVFAWASNVPVQGIVRHGVVPAGAVVAGLPPQPVERASFVLDMDMFMAAPQRFSAEALAEQYRSLHGEIEKIFFWSLTEAGRKLFELRIEEE